MPVIICAHIGFGRVNNLNLNICTFQKKKVLVRFVSYTI